MTADPRPATSQDSFADCRRSKDPFTADEILEGLAREGGALRLDRLSILAHRLTAALADPDLATRPRARANLVRFLLLDALPIDLCLALHQELVDLGGAVAAAIDDPRLADRLLGAL